MKVINLVKTAVSLILVLAVQSSFAVIIDFETFSTRDELVGVGETVTTKGYTLTYTPAPGEPYPVGFHIVGKSYIYNYSSTALLANSCSAITELKSKTNTPFRLKQIDLSENGEPGLITNLVFEGRTQTGRVITHAVNIDGIKGPQRVTFPTHFTDLTSVKWTQGNCIPDANNTHFFDNIRVTVPTTGGESDD